MINPNICSFATCTFEFTEIGCYWHMLKTVLSIQRYLALLEYRSFFLITFKEVKMAMEIPMIADEMYNLIVETHGTERYKPQDIFKVMMEKHKDEGVNKKSCKEALKSLIKSEKLVYTVLNGSCTSLVGLPGCEEENSAG